MNKKKILPLILTCIFLAGCGKNTEIQDVAAIEQAVEETSVHKSTAEAAGELSEITEDSSDEASSVPSKETDKEAGSTASSSAASSEEKASEQASKEESKPSASEEATNEPAVTEAEPEQNVSAQEPKDYGNIIFVGDSRTVDIFDADAFEVYDRNEGGVRVFAHNGKGHEYLLEILSHIGWGCDTVITWLGCNDHYNIELYKQTYEEILSKDMNLVICNVGPTVNENLDEWDSTRYRNEDMVAFNEQITAWANAHGVKVIDMYSYVSANLEIEPDGIHYIPQPTSKVWDFIMSQL